MTEQEYMTAQELTRVRIAIGVFERYYTGKF